MMGWSVIGFYVMMGWLIITYLGFMTMFKKRVDLIARLMMLTMIMVQGLGCLSAKAATISNHQKQ